MSEPTFDANQHERRSRIAATAECSRCGRDVPLIQETESWVQGEDGRWHHQHYGPAQGVCCDILIVDSWDGCAQYDLAATAPDDDTDEWEPPAELGGEG